MPKLPDPAKDNELQDLAVETPPALDERNPRVWLNPDEDDYEEWQNANEI